MSNLLTTSKRFVKKNGSDILTIIGAVGVVSTAVTAVKATPKVMELLELSKAEKGDELTTLEKVQIAGPSYIPSILLGTVTIVCIFGSNRLNKHTQVGLMSAYALLNQSYKEYKNKVKKLYGEDGDKLINAAIAKDHYDDEEVKYYEEDELPLFYDSFSKRYFNASNERMYRAKYEINKMVSTNGVATLNDFYELVGLPVVDYGEYLGWSANQMIEMYWDGWIYFYYTKVEMDDGLECYIIDYTEPFPDYDEY